MDRLAAEKQMKDFFHKVILTQNWKRFSENLITKQRFVPDEKDEQFISYLADLIADKFAHTVPAKTLFYRARIITGEDLTLDGVEYPCATWDADKCLLRGFSALSDVGAPPANKAGANRANPKGIPRLYIADSIETAVAEVRPSLCEVVNIVEFTNPAPLSIVKLPKTVGDALRISSDDQGSLDRRLYNICEMLSWEFSKPIRREDSESEYLPTQYLTEKILSGHQNIHGIAYPSKQSDEGTNYVLFNPDMVELSGKNELLIRIKHICYEGCDLNDPSKVVQAHSAGYNKEFTQEDARAIKQAVLSQQHQVGQEKRQTK